MKRGFLFFLFFLLLFTTSAYAIESKTATYSVGSGKKTVTYVQFHANEGIELKPAMAQNTVGKVDSLANIAKSNNAIAAINGTFFNPYDANDLQPLGAVMINQKLEHLRGGSVAIGIAPDNNLLFGNANEIKIKGGINGSREYPNNWYAWFLNHTPTTQDEIVVFTPSFKQTSIVKTGFTFVVVSNGKVIKKEMDKAYIPRDGFVIAYGSNTKDASKFNVGDSAEYWIEYPDVLSNAMHLISVVPKLVTNGQATVDFSSFTEAKITTNAAQRSFIGIKADKTIVMGTAANITMKDLAGVLVQMGLVEAINLDGGASSGLYYNGKYTTTPGRNISNALIVVKKEKYPRVELNGKEILFPDAKPYIDNANRVLVPVRFIAEQYGAEVGWNEMTKIVTVKLRNKEIKLEIDKKMAEVNGQAVELDTKATIRGNRTFVPIRFITETFDSVVDWDSNRNMVILKSEIKSGDLYYKKGLEFEKANNFQDASLQFEKAVEMNPNDSDAWSHLGLAYSMLENYEKSVSAYQKVNSDNVLVALGWSAYSAKKFNIAIEAFEKASKIKGMEAQGYYGLGVTYMHYEVGEKGKAKAALETVIMLDPNGNLASQARELIKKL